MPSSVIMQRSGAGVATKESSNSATNETLPLETARCATVGETSETQILNPEVVRRQRGNDKQYFRANYGTGRTAYR